MHMTAAEVLLRHQEAARRVGPWYVCLGEMLIAPLMEMVAARVWWRAHTQEAMRSTAFQLTYNPKD